MMRLRRLQRFSMNQNLNSKVKFCTVKLSEVIARGKRLEASVFDVEAMQAYQLILNGKHKFLSEMIDSAYYGGRLKRNYVSKSNKSIGFIGSSEMLDCYPKPVKFMVDSDSVNDLRVKYGTILISRSGTIGNLTFVNKTLSKLLISEHAIRLDCGEFAGYIYTYLKSKIGQLPNVRIIISI